MALTKGKFIVIDGTDGSGKTTQFALLAEKLRQQGEAVEVADFPQYNNKSGGLIEEYLSGKYGTAEQVGPEIASIFFAADRYDASFKIRRWLEEGKIVLSNRYVSANMGHQGGKINDPEKRKKFLDWLYDLEYNLFKIPQPDLSIILHLKPEIAQQLAQQRQREDWSGKKTDIHEENINHLRQAEQAYLEIAKQPGFTLIECTENEQILSREAIQEKIWHIVKQNLYAPINKDTITNSEGSIEVICGCMFSGKSTEGAKRVTKEILAKNRRLMIFVPREARRTVIMTETGNQLDTAGKMVSRNGKIFDAIEFNKNRPEEILFHIEKLKDKPTTVVIEEAHFCAPSLVRVCKVLSEDYHNRVIVIGLDQTFDDQGFGPIPELMVEAEFVTKELAVCVECGSQKASKSWLDPGSKAQLEGKVLVGDQQYLALCRHCKKKYQERLRPLF